MYLLWSLMLRGRILCILTHITTQFDSLWLLWHLNWNLVGNRFLFWTPWHTRACYKCRIVEGSNDSWALGWGPLGQQSTREPLPHTHACTYPPHPPTHTLPQSASADHTCTIRMHGTCTKPVAIYTVKFTQHAGILVHQHQAGTPE